MSSLIKTDNQNPENKLNSYINRNNSKSLPFDIKYYPQNMSELTVHKKEAELLLDFAKNYKKQKKKSVLIYGPTGIGKTTLAYCVAKTFNYEILEMNSSDYRDKGSINSVVGQASKQQSLFSQGKIILIDEIDAISGQKDRGAVSEIQKLILESSFPVFLTATDPWDSKLAPIRKNSIMIELKELEFNYILDILKKISDAEKIDYDELSLKQIARSSGNDIRSAINDLQALSSSGKLSKNELVDMFDRDKSVSMPKILQIIFKSKDFNLLNLALFETDFDSDEIFLWLEENIPLEYKNADDLYSAIDYLSKADIFKRRIMRQQHWRLLSYIFAYLSVGIGLSKKEKYSGNIQYKQSSKILSLWISNQKNAKKKSISEKIANKIHISNKKAFKSYLYYKSMISDKFFMENFAKEFDLDNDEISHMLKSN